MNTWVRLWRDMPTDPKFRAIARKSGRPLAEVIAMFAYMMTIADEHGRLASWDCEDAAAAMDIDLNDSQSIFEAMQGKVLDGEILTGWTKRQPKREDDSRKRVQEFRERKKQERNAHVTQCNAPESESESDTESEVVTSVRRVAAREEGDGRTPAYQDLKSKFNGSTETMLVFIEKTMGPGSRAHAETWLSSTVSAHGQQAVAQAFAAMTEKIAAGEIITRPLPRWSNIAASLKNKQSKQNTQPQAKRTLAEVLRERREAEKAA